MVTTQSRNQKKKGGGASGEDLRELNVEELRERARQAGVKGRSSMKKDELVRALSGSGGGKREKQADDDRGGGSQRPVVHSEKTKYSQEISSPDDDPERAGRSLITTNHDVIKE